MTSESFEIETAIAEMLMDDVLLIGDFIIGGNDTHQLTISVLCNDTFAWATADSEPLSYHEVEPLYQMWLEDKMYGPVRWCCLKRKMRPQEPLIRVMKEAGRWTDDLEVLP